MYQLLNGMGEKILFCDNDKGEGRVPLHGTVLVQNELH